MAELQKQSNQSPLNDDMMVPTGDGGSVRLSLAPKTLPNVPQEDTRFSFEEVHRSGDGEDLAKETIYRV